MPDRQLAGSVTWGALLLLRICFFLGWVEITLITMRACAHAQAQAAAGMGGLHELGVTAILVRRVDRPLPGVTANPGERHPPAKGYGVA